MPDYREDMFFFDGASGAPLLGFLTQPDAAETGDAIVYVHPFAEEKNCSHAIIAKAAREFAKSGFSIFRFDFSGCGDSGGEMTDFTLQDWLQDISAAVEETQRRTKAERVWLWGLRHGGSLAMAAAGRDERIRGLILWQPVFGFQRFMQQFLRQKIVAEMGDSPNNSIKTMHANIMAGGTVEVNGYPLAEPLYSSFADFDSDAAAAPQREMPVLLLSISQMQNPPAAMAGMGQKINARAAGDFIHVVDEPFWDRYWRRQSAVIETTKNWLTHQGD